MRQESHQKLNLRKSKLAMLLKGEEDKYIHELQFIELTEEQRRDNMRTKVAKLKAEKEDQRQAYVAHQYERQFKNGADALRKIESNLNEIKSMQEREIQMMERQNLLEEKYKEEIIYAELYKKQIAQKEHLEKEKKAAQLAKVQQRNEILAVQCEQRKQTRIRDEILKQQERNMLNQEWAVDDMRHKQRQQEEFERQMRLNATLVASNKQQKAFRKEQQKKEHDEDMKLIGEIIERERMQEKLEKEKIEKQKEETRQFLLNFKDRRGETHRMDALEQKLIDEENEKQWKNRAAVWDAEEKARIKLMYAVYDNRDAKLKEMERIKQEEIKFIQNERKEEDDRLIAYEKEVEEKRQRIALRNKGHQGALLGQISYKVNKKETAEAVEKKRYETHVQKEADYDRKIKEALEDGKRRLAE